jgi:hypothetical protein
VLVCFDYVASRIVNADQRVVRITEELCVRHRFANFEIQQPQKSQHIADQINTVFILAGVDFISVNSLIRIGHRIVARECVTFCHHVFMLLLCAPSERAQETKPTHLNDVRQMQVDSVLTNLLTESILMNGIARGEAILIICGPYKKWLQIIKAWLSLRTIDKA